MTLILQRPWSLTTYSPFSNTTSTQTGTKSDTQMDDRSYLRKTPRAAWRPPTPYYRRVETGHLYCFDLQAADNWHVPGYPDWVRFDMKYAGAHNMSGYYYVPPPDIPFNLEQKAIVKARLKLKNVKVNLAQNFGERKQTERLVTDTLVRLRTMVLDVRRLKPKPSDAFNLWLELQYGWKPLLSDVHGSISQLHQREQEILRPITTVKAVTRDHENQLITLHDAVSSSNFSVDRERRIAHQCMVRLDFVEDENPVVNRTLSQLGITNPLELAWELLPFSFVADWFIPIGDYLSQLDATLGYTFKGGSCSRKTRVETHVKNIVWDASASAGKEDRVSSLSCNGYGYQVVFDRRVYDSAPIGLPDIAKLSTGSGMHVTNGIALLGSAISGALRVR